MAEAIPINENSQLQADDRLQVVITRRWDLGETINSLVTAGKLNSFENRDDWIVESYTYTDTGVIVNIRVVDAQAREYEAGFLTPALITTAIIGFSAMFVSVATYKIVADVTDTIENPIAQATVKTLGMSTIVMVIIGVFLWLKLSKS